MIITTLGRIRELSPCEDMWKKLLAGLGKTAGDGEPLPFAKILEINGLADALWCCRAEPQYDREWRLLAVAYARRVEHLCTDPAVKNARAWAARAAWAAEDAARAAWDAAGDAARDAAEAAGRAAWVAAEAAWVAASAAARDAARDAARAAASAAWDAARAAVWAAEREWQTQEFLRVVTETGAKAPE